MHDKLMVEAGSKAVSRRKLMGIGAAGAVAAVATPGVVHAAPFKVDAKRVSIPTQSGTVDGLFYAASGSKHPGVVMWADANGQAVARRLAEQGFAVLLANGTRHMDADHQAINREAKGLVAWLSQQEGVENVRALPKSNNGLGNGYVLRSITAAQPRLSLASKEERKAHAMGGMLVAMPVVSVARSPQRMEVIEHSARLALKNVVRAA